jgi:hypothetical protein
VRIDRNPLIRYPNPLNNLSRQRIRRTD